jgi:hypothetical protein
MTKISMWWLFLALFGSTIGGIHSLGRWARPAAAYDAMVPAANSRVSDVAALRHRNGEATHWRSVFMQN